MRWLVYPAYPQHSFSLWGLVHTYIPQTGTPCGRVIGNRSYSLTWAFLFRIAVPSPFVPLLYHTLKGLSRGFRHFCRNFLFLLDSYCGWPTIRTAPLDLSRRVYSRTQPCCGVLSPFPLDIIIIPRIASNVNRFLKKIKKNLMGFSPHQTANQRL